MIRKTYFLLLVTLLTAIYSNRVYAQNFLEEDKIAIADSIGVLLDRFNEALRIDLDQKAEPELYKERFIGFFYRPESRLVNFALPDSIIGYGEFLTASDYTDKSITNLYSIDLLQQVRYFGSLQRSLRGFTDELDIRSHGSGHVVTIPIEFRGFESRVFNERTDLPETVIEHRGLELVVDVYFESSVRARRFMQTNPRDVYAFSVREIRFPEVIPDIDDIEDSDPVTRRIGKEEMARVENLIRDRIKDLEGDVNTFPPLMGLKHPITAELSPADQYRLLDFFAYPNVAWIDESIFFPDAVGEYISPKEYVDKLLDDQISLDKMLSITGNQGTFIYLPAENCKNLMHIFYLDTFEIAGRYNIFENINPGMALFFQFDVDYESRFLSSDIYFVGIPRIAGINSTKRLLECIPPPPTWSLSVGVNYLYDYHSFGMNDMHSLDGLKSTWEHSSAGGFDLRYNRLSGGELEWGVSAGFSYGVVQAGFRTRDLSMSKHMEEQHENFSGDDDPAEYNLIISGQDLAQQTEYRSMMIPLRFHLLYNVSNNSFFDFSAGLQLSINDQPTTSQAGGTLDYKGEFEFFEEGNTYVIDNIPEYGFTDYPAHISGPDIGLTDFTLGGLASVKFATRISSGLPLYLEFGPHLYVGFNEVFNPHDDIDLVRKKGEMDNMFNYAGTGKNHAFGFSAGLRFFVR